MNEDDKFNELEVDIDKREISGEMLTQIAETSKRALSSEGILIDLFFLVPTGGSAILTFGTTADDDVVSNALWQRVIDLVSAVVRNCLKIERIRTNEIACTMMHADRQT